MDIRKLDSYVKTLEGISDEMKTALDDGLKELSQIDARCNDLYHYIELGKYDAVQGWKLLKELRESLEERRKIKDNIETIQSVYQSFGDSTKKIKKSVSNRKNKICGVRIYKYRTNAVEKALNVKQGSILKNKDGKMISNIEEEK